MDTAPMTLDDTHGEILKAHAKGQNVARVHSGDPSLYGAIAEQIRRLKADGIDYQIIPGVPAYAAAAAALGTELTVPEVAQSITTPHCTVGFRLKCRASAGRKMLSLMKRSVQGWKSRLPRRKSSFPKSKSSIADVNLPFVDVNIELDLRLGKLDLRLWTRLFINENDFSSRESCFSPSPAT